MIPSCVQAGSADEIRPLARARGSAPHSRSLVQRGGRVRGGLYLVSATAAPDQGASSRVAGPSDLAAALRCLLVGPFRRVFISGKRPRRSRVAHPPASFAKTSLLRAWCRREPLRKVKRSRA